MLELNVDGIRADVAAIKPYLFWKNLIDYTRLKDSEFLFLAESSDSWKKPISDYAPYTNYFNLLKAGFDGYYGSFFNLKSFKNITQFEKLISFNKKLFKKFNNKKSVIGCFSTHDELSPILIGGKNFSILTMWLNATLNINPYFVDGIYGADNYIYKFSNKKLNYTFTDNDIAYVHEGKLDIFNFSRKPKNDDIDLINMFKKALDFRVKNQAIINNGRFSILKTSNKNVFAYQIEYNNLNQDLSRIEKVEIGLDELLLDISGLDDHSTDGVILSTIHSVKGLEFRAVFVIGLEEGIFPAIREEVDMEEERRVAYVAFTRAKEKLYLTCSARRLIYGRLVRNPKSRFLMEYLKAEEVKKAVEEKKVSIATPGEIEIGSRVNHKFFGNGLVIAKDDYFVQILFDKDQSIKKISKGHPTLTKIA